MPTILRIKFILLISISILLTFFTMQTFTFAEESSTGVFSHLSEAKTFGISLTRQEDAWLKAHPVIKVGHSSAFEPIFIKGSGGIIKGVLPDLFSEIGRRLNVKMEFIDDDWFEIFRRIQEKEIDLIGMVNLNLARQKGLLTTSPPFKNLVTVFAKKSRKFDIKSDDDLNGLRVAYFTKTVFLGKYLENRRDLLTPIKADSALNALKYVMDGKADIMVGLNSHSYLLSKYVMPEIEPVHVMKKLNAATAIGIRADAPLLVSILEKAFDSLSQEKRRQIISKWSWVPEQSYPRLNLTPTQINFLKNKPYLTIACIKDFAPFSFVRNGEPSGYSIEYMQLLGRILGKEIRFVIKPWRELLSMLKSGELDIIPHIAHTPERESFIDYTQFNHITYTTGFAIRKNEQLNNLKELSGDRTLAIAKNTFLHEYFKTNYPDIPLTLVDNSSTAVEFVSKNKAFAVVGSLPYINYHIQQEWLSNLKMVTVDDIGIPKKTELPMGVAKGNSVLLSILETAHDAMQVEDVLKLRQKWISGYITDSRDFSLSETEQRFIEQHPTIRFRVRTGFPPFEFEENGEAAGIAVDYIKAIAKKVGITPRFKVEDKAYLDLFKMKDIDPEELGTLVYSAKNETSADYFVHGDVYLSNPMMIISHKKGPFIAKTADLVKKRVAAVKESYISKWLKKDYPGIKMISVATAEEALQLVNKGKADAYIGNLAVVNYMIIHKNMDNLKIAAPSDHGNINYNFVAPKDWPELASILSKGYRSLSPHEHNLLQQKWFSFQIIEKVNYTLIIRLLVVVSCIIILILWWNRTLQIQKGKTDIALSKLQETQALLKEKYVELEKVSITDKLTSLYNRLKLDTVLQDEFERYKRYGNPLGVIMIDVDFFKQVNDTYGHQVGDTFLIELSKLLITNIRNVDIAGRWGGEEFLIICPQTGKEGIRKMAENIRIKIEDHEFSTVGHKTASFGVTISNKGDTIDKLISKADKALYKSKEAGRNKVTCV